MKSAVHVKCDKPNLAALVEAAIAQAMWRSPEQFAGLAGQTVDMEVKIEVMEEATHHVGEVS